MGFLSGLKSFGNSVEKWGDNIVSGGENTVKWTVNQGENTINKAESSITNIVEIPLILIAGGIFFLLWNSNIGQVADTTKNVAPLFV